MIKLYTPESWYSFFSGYPELIVDDDGLIYGKESFGKLVKEPAGRIDTDSGFIYGPDYRKFGAQPIGRVKKNGAAAEIYGSDYAAYGARPVLYIKDNAAYSYEEYHRLFGSPAAFLSSDAAAPTAYAPQPNPQRDPPPDGSGPHASAFGWVFTILLIFALASAYGWISGEITRISSVLELLLVLLPVLVSGAIAFFRMRGASVIRFTILASGVLAWFAAAVFDLVTEGLTLTWLLADLLFGWLVTIPLCAFPALILSGLVLLLQKITGRNRKKP